MFDSLECKLFYISQKKSLFFLVFGIFFYNINQSGTFNSHLILTKLSTNTNMELYVNIFHNPILQQNY